MPTSHAIEQLRTAIEQLRPLCVRLRSQVDGAASPSLEDLTQLFTEVGQTADVLRRLPSRAITQIEASKELQEYRACLEDLKKVLPAVQGQLFTQKAHLEAERARLNAAAAWSQLRKTVL